MLDVMLDLETMGNGPRAAILAIGAVAFDQKTSIVGERFYQTVDLETSVAAGGEIDASTVLWWMQQSEAARSEFSRKGEHISKSLLAFKTWMSNFGASDLIRVWGNGAAFDNVILSSAYKAANIQKPWEFWNDRCYRTIKEQRPDIVMKRVGHHHKAVDDAESQALHLIELLSK